MGAWEVLRHRLLRCLAHRPELKRAVQGGISKVRRSSQIRKAEERVRAYYHKTVMAASVGQGNHQQRQSGKKGNPEFSYFREPKQRLLLEWHKNKRRVFAFATANFFLIVMVLFQLIPVLYRRLTAPLQEPRRQQLRSEQQQTALNEEDERRKLSTAKKRRKREQQLAEENTENEKAFQTRGFSYTAAPEGRPLTLPRQTDSFGNLSEKLGLGKDSTTAAPAKATALSPPGFTTETRFSSSMFDDTSTVSSTKGSSVQEQFNAMHHDVFQNSGENGGVQIGFDTSFLVRMGDETEFTSSLDREHLTGAQSTH